MSRAIAPLNVGVRGLGRSSVAAFHLFQDPPSGGLGTLNQCRPGIEEASVSATSVHWISRGSCEALPIMVQHTTQFATSGCSSLIEIQSSLVGCRCLVPRWVRRSASSRATSIPGSLGSLLVVILRTTMQTVRPVRKKGYVRANPQSRSIPSRISFSVAS
jgi:hypothetical protein